MKKPTLQLISLLANGKARNVAKTPMLVGSELLFICQAEFFDLAIAGIFFSIMDRDSY